MTKFIVDPKDKIYQKLLSRYTEYFRVKVDEYRKKGMSLTLACITAFEEDDRTISSN